jgi:hypothetical protein
MSHDQRPGRVRVFSSGGPAETPPQRRRTDPPPATAATPLANAAPALSLRTLAMRGALFLAACATGGALTEIYHLPEMLVR